MVGVIEENLMQLEVLAGTTFFQLLNASGNSREGTP
jgi:hypothetical protein